MSSNVIHQAPSARRQASPSKRTTGNTSHSCFAVSLVAAAIALAACPAMAAGMVTAGSGAGVAVGATSSTTGANQVAVGPNARTDSTYSGNAGEASMGTLARAVSRSVKIPLATTAQPFLVSTITPVRSAT